MQPHTLPVAIGAKVTLPGGTVVEVLGVSNGHVGLAIVEATVPAKPRAASRPPRPRKRGYNGRGRQFAALNDCDSWEQYWSLYDAKKGWSSWNRKYKDFGGWLAAHSEPHEFIGRELTLYDARAKGYECRPTPDPKQKAHIRS